MNEEFEVCPVCNLIGGYCGGFGHPSCGFFEDGAPAPAREVPSVINLTPHEIKIMGRSGWVSYPASGDVARVEMHTTPTESPLPGVYAHRQKRFGVSGLPAWRHGTIYLVSIVVLYALEGHERTDVFAPDTGPDSAVRDGTGKIIGVKALVAP